MTTVVGIPQVVVFSCLLTIAGCSKHTTEPQKGTPVAAKASTGTAAAVTPAVEEGKHGSRKMKNVEVPVFVDGAQAAVLRFGELPSTVKPFADPNDPNHDARYYRISDYLRGVGVDVDHVKSVHMLGNREKVASIDGDELRADKTRFAFDFMTGTSGIAKSRWDTTGLKNTYRIDEIRMLSVYVTKAAPAIDAEQQCHLQGGECNANDVYAQGELAKGTRVYVDGKLAGYVKRRQLQDKTIVGKQGEDDVFSLSKFMTQLGVDPGSPRGIELMAGDEVFARVDAASWKTAQNQITFTLQKHAHGKVRMHVPAAFQAHPADGAAGAPTTDRDLTVTSVLVYRSTPVTARGLVSFDDLAEPTADENPNQLQAANDRQREKFGSGQANE